MHNLLVTGGCGFIGGNLLRYLLTESSFEGRVINVDALTYAGNPQSVADLAARSDGRYVFVQADICDAEVMARLFDDYQIDSVCHFAAESHVDRSIAGPGAVYPDQHPRHLHAAGAGAGSVSDQLIRFHHVSTDEVFGSLGEEGYFTETDALPAQQPLLGLQGGVGPPGARLPRDLRPAGRRSPTAPTTTAPTSSPRS